MRDLVYYVATSVDGYIADASGDFTVFPQHPNTLQALFSRYPETCPVQARETLGIKGAPARFDTVIMGRRTYQPALDYGLPDGAYPHLTQYVVTHGHLPASSTVRRIDGDVTRFIADLKQQPGKDIWLCGGANLATQLLNQIDEIQLKVNPVLLGTGIPLFRGATDPLALQLVETEALPGGVLLNTYRRPSATA